MTTPEIPPPSSFNGASDDVHHRVKTTAERYREASAIIESVQGFKGKTDVVSLAAARICLRGMNTWSSDEPDNKSDFLAESDWKRVERQARKESLSGHEDEPEVRAMRLAGGVPNRRVIDAGDGINAFAIGDLDAFLDTLISAPASESSDSYEAMLAHVDKLLEWIHKNIWSPSIAGFRNGPLMTENDWKDYCGYVRQVAFDLLEAAEYFPAGRSGFLASENTAPTRNGEDGQCNSNQSSKATCVESNVVAGVAREACGQKGDPALLGSKDSVNFKIAECYLGIKPRQRQKLIKDGTLVVTGYGSNRKITVESVKKYCPPI